MLEVFLTFLVTAAIYCYRRFTTKAADGILVLRPLVSPLSAIGFMFRNHDILNPGGGWSWRARQAAYGNYQHDMVAFFPLLPFSRGGEYHISSLEVMKQVWGNDSHAHHIKPRDLTLVRLFGESVASGGGDSWRRHRRVVAPTINSATLKTVWYAARRVVREMFVEEKWDEREQMCIKNIHPLLLKLTLAALCETLFGVRASWSSAMDDSHQFKESLRIVSESLVPRLVLPTWVYGLTAKLRVINEAWTGVISYVSTSIETAKTTQEEDTTTGKQSVLDLLAASALGPSSKYTLSNRETIANVFTLLFAGHETVASTLLTTLAYLAIHQDEQQAAYKEIHNAFPSGVSNDGLQDYDQCIRLTHTLHCFWEAQRLLPTSFFMPRELTQDFVVTVSRPEPATVVLKKGDVIIADLVAIFRNPHDYDDPEAFRPTRWDGVSEHDFPGFGYGPRICAGRKLAQTVGLAVLATVLQDWRVEPLLRGGESVQQYEERVVRQVASVGTSWVFEEAPLKFSKRLSTS
ncbi:cytochrome P450 [Peniophora sp. CONT]|nr:cytochrome P450 [Peniophora sp. CONT]